jgi:hypothetical protein
VTGPPDERELLHAERSSPGHTGTFVGGRRDLCRCRARDHRATVGPGNGADRADRIVEGPEMAQRGGTTQRGEIRAGRGGRVVVGMDDSPVAAPPCGSPFSTRPAAARTSRSLPRSDPRSTGLPCTAGRPRGVSVRTLAEVREMVWSDAVRIADEVKADLVEVLARVPSVSVRTVVEAARVPEASAVPAASHSFVV